VSRREREETAINAKTAPAKEPERAATYIVGSISSAGNGYLLASFQELKVLNTKTLYLELNYTLTGSFALIGNHPCLRRRYQQSTQAMIG
jgi:hypothetical protein